MVVPPGFREGHFDGTEFGASVTVLEYVQENFGEGPALHVHKYDEIFIILSGKVLFKIGDDYIEAEAGDVLFGPANVPHRFKNVGFTPLETMDIHLSDKWVQDNLEDSDADW
ncbi:cupin domain-containing protein [Enterobacter cloacae]|uniref:cupin domain-containing protein n=1 Tax=Enterobacter cloacae TaxID=550 RepID=UPI0025A2C87A|nr:cupin domain-containing protein [Enterobacter cloacae]MDM6891151.1 cupin domain-containing protein [Enterobacter cloacae]